MMNLNNQAIGTNRNCRPRYSANQNSSSSPMRRIGDDGQVREFLCQGDCSKIDCVSQFRFEGLDSTFTENNLRVSSGEQVLRGQKPFLNRRRWSTLQQDRAIDFRESP